MPKNIQCIIDELSLDSSILQIWLIGSQVNGCASSSSDWDILIFSNQEPKVVSRRYSDVDILWSGPSKNTLAQGQSEDYVFSFDDFKWNEKDDGIAEYHGKKFTDQVSEVARNASDPVLHRTIQKAIRIWTNSILQIN